MNRPRVDVTIDRLTLEGRPGPAEIAAAVARSRELPAGVDPSAIGAAIASAAPAPPAAAPEGGTP